MSGRFNLFSSLADSMSLLHGRSGLFPSVSVFVFSVSVSVSGMDRPNYLADILVKLKLYSMLNMGAAIHGNIPSVYTTVALRCHCRSISSHYSLNRWDISVFCRSLTTVALRCHCRSNSSFEAIDHSISPFLHFMCEQRCCDQNNSAWPICQQSSDVL
jgi:hypothetical protein